MKAIKSHPVQLLVVVVLAMAAGVLHANDYADEGQAFAEMRVDELFDFGLPLKTRLLYFKYDIENHNLSRILNYYDLCSPEIPPGLGARGVAVVRTWQPPGFELQYRSGVASETLRSALPYNAVAHIFAHRANPPMRLFALVSDPHLSTSRCSPTQDLAYALRIGVGRLSTPAG